MEDSLLLPQPEPGFLFNASSVPAEALENSFSLER